jgi:hypothetical protein
MQESDSAELNRTVGTLIMSLPREVAVRVFTPQYVITADIDIYRHGLGLPMSLTQQLFCAKRGVKPHSL